MSHDGAMSDCCGGAFAIIRYVLRKSDIDIGIVESAIVADVGHERLTVI
jgi:hypothetical protein